MKHKLLITSVSLLVILLISNGYCCGPNLPERLLMQGNSGLLATPETNFNSSLNILIEEIENPIEGQSEDDYSGRALTDDTDISEFNRAVELSDITLVQQQELREKYSEYRKFLKKSGVKYVSEDEKRELLSWLGDNFSNAPDILRQYFGYLLGAAYYRFGDNENARMSWKMLLLLPEELRKERSVWASYMIGRSVQEADMYEALKWYGKTGELVRLGYNDSLNLHRNSLGWQAHFLWNEGQSPEVFEIYLRLNDKGSLLLLCDRLSSRDSLKDTDLEQYALNVLSRQVITLYLLSSPEDYFPVEFADEWFQQLLHVTLDTEVEAIEVALLTYKLGLYELCEQWLAKAEQSVLASRLRVKLYLRKGEVNKAVADLALLIRLLPLQIKKDAMSQMHEDSEELSEAYIKKILLGDLGTLYLSRGLFIKAFDNLYKGEHWGDAAYVAERVLTVEELINYVNTISDMPDGLRYLLGRRLIRLERFEEAKLYLPEDLQQELISYQHLFLTGYDTSSINNMKKSEALVKAAFLIRKRGKELLATEVEPDWYMYNCYYDHEYISAERGPVSEENFSGMSAKEEQRLKLSREQTPSNRFHYIYVAAELAWDASLLMPDNTNNLASLLCEAGSWLKHTDPSAADKFYKSLVSRAPMTELGKEADIRRWFPKCPVIYE